MGKEEQPIKVWDNILSVALRLPGAKVNRNEFLQSTISHHYGDLIAQKAISGSPLDVLSYKQIDELAKICIRSYKNSVTTLSALAGIPGGFALIGAIPADLGQYYCHCIALAQKLSYLYGFPNLTDEEGGVSEEGKGFITVYLGIMMGAKIGNNVLTKVAKEFAEQVAKRLPQKALTKTSWYPIVKQIGKWLGVNITKQTVSKGVAKVIPILGAVISGGVTYTTFTIESNRLRKHLQESAHELHDGISPKKQMHYYENIEDADFVGLE